MSQFSRLSQRARWAHGQPISELMARALAAPQLISLAAGFVDQHTLPVEATRAAMQAMLGDDNSAQAALQYGTTHGFPPLREAIREQHLAADGGPRSQPPIDLDQIFVTAGSNQLLHIVSESLLDPGDIVLCAAPTYFVYLGTLQNMGARAIAVATDEHGIVPEGLEETLQRLANAGELPRVKAIYVVTYFDNPRGLTTPAQRRAAIVECARRWSQHGPLYVLADDAYRPLRYAGDDVPGMRTYDEHGDLVICAGTFSKCFSPGIRVGWGIVPKSLVGAIHDQKGNLDFGSPNFAQHLMYHVVTSGKIEPHVRELRAGYRRKLETMLAACRTHLTPLCVKWVDPAGGLYVWITLPEEIDAGPAGRLFDLALDEGMLYVPGQFCYASEGEPVSTNTIRLSFGVQTQPRIAEGIEKLARAIGRL
jgi:2-aminoadipate transaminase